MTTVLIEDYALLRVALEHVLLRVQGAGEVIVLSAQQLGGMTFALNQPVELLVMDAHPDAVQAVDTLERALALFAPKVVLTLYAAEEAAVLAAFARRGVRGYIPQSSSPAALAAAVSLVLAGGECYPRRDPIVVESLRPPAGGRSLTQRQDQILSLLVQGHSMREIAAQIGISAATVKSHARALYWKLNVRNQAEAAFVAQRQGLVSWIDEKLKD